MSIKKLRRPTYSVSICVDGKWLSCEPVFEDREGAESYAEELINETASVADFRIDIRRNVPATHMWIEGEVHKVWGFKND